MDKRIEKLRPTGKFSFWKYDSKRKYLGWHFRADKNGIDFLATLLDFMSNSEWSSHKTLTLCSPKEVMRVVPHEENWTAKRQLKLNFQKNAQPTLWDINEQGDTIEISFGLEKLNEFKRALARIHANENDFTITDKDGNQKNILWFW